MYKLICTFFFLMTVLTIGKADEHEPRLWLKCTKYANESQHQCLEKQLAISMAELEASMFAVRKMMAQWGEIPSRRVAEENFEKTIGEFERYKHAQCEYFASMRYGLGDRDEVGIIRLECMLKLNAQRTKVFNDLTTTIIM